MKFIVIISSALLVTGTVVGATAQDLSARTTLYKSSRDSVVLEPAYASYRIQRTGVAGKSQLDTIFYVASGRLLKVVRTTWLPTGDTLTVVEGLRANGRPHYVRHELGRKAHGEYRGYDERGRLQRKAQFERGKEQSAECYSKNGALVSCSQYAYTEKMPEFPGGFQAMLSYIGRTMRYPGKALREQRQGRVFLTFVVAETGEVRCAQVTKGVSPELDAEALRVIGSMPRFKPGQQDGEAVPVYFTVPVTFAIK
ncbi:energy transducer TonB [Hymenobacter lapidiphilus]|uniref:energy transducer TonB n=1 Tax=Hymenobacter sp. CCM 8763 TaxID=2303334 RepID=UPI000E346858|nr:energy transducer TonB [Hymenobacter sp. CCM 8763]RFP66677.1 energy transducer TonB [Hymenobacter sp. CCM 8763]